ncbi:MAG: hypothetical protein Fur0010_23730 [Bdellovibrio sp.]
MSLQAAVLGKDNRISFSQLEEFNPSKLASATATQIEVRYLKESNIEEYATYPSGKLQNTCPGEKYSEFHTLGGCSGFLIDENILVTAGHCRDYSKGCDQEAWLFNHFESPQYPQAKLKKENIVRCLEVLDYRHDGEADFAVLKLERKIKNATILKIDLADQAETNDPVAVLGYPLGLPFVYTPGGRIIKKEKNLILTDSDAFKNNSGSALFNLRTGYVEGILTNSMRGMSSNQLDGCQLSLHYKQNDYKTIINRLSRIPYLQKNYSFTEKLKKFEIYNKCNISLKGIIKYRDYESNDWKTKSVVINPEESVVVNESDRSNYFLHIRSLDNHKILSGKDFYGFENSDRETEFGFKKIEDKKLVIEDCRN